MKSTLYKFAAFIFSFCMLIPVSFAQDGFIKRVDFTKKILQMSNFEIPDSSYPVGFNDISNLNDIMYIAAANKYGIAQGYGESFRPDDYITKEQALVMLVRAMDEESFALQMDEDKIHSLLDFEDKDQISPWAIHSVAYLVENGLIQAGEKLMPNSLITSEYSDEIYLDCKSYFDSNLSKEGYSAALMLEKSSEKLSSYNTYKFKGSMDIDTITTVPSADDISITETENLKMELIQEGIFEKPQRIYSKSTTTITPLSQEQEKKLEGMTTQSCEVYFDEEEYLMKMPGEDFWISMDINPLVKDLQSMTGGHSVGSQALTRDQMKLFGMYSRFADDTKINGREYYSIDVSLDSDAFNLILREFVNKTLEYYDTGIRNASDDSSVSEDDIDQLKSMLSSMVSNMSAAVKYKFYIDKETLDYRFMDIVQNTNIRLGDIISTSNSAGRFEYYDFDIPVDFPEIDRSSIKTIPSLIDGNGESIAP
ncbi:S-layer homology domain-containing protein [Peptoclostridium litorale DSM 5388]|uniref:SLH domain-containing protein n=1 Tax=Peptoclostridium litorale DSM 5388 TaxID=1121324 RepID=A0A069RKZ5_PEPLI|nr:S-layer homology domain-containing protein [Peptoclostridium litorale]KDR94897.1 hypothetical protein CLIT_13c02190 [Peptoclostridium litorale DSM 5388]SIN95130.1 S-layer homology domain-containing protein [Peptoclostridium litorale DSM 5388]